MKKGLLSLAGVIIVSDAIKNIVKKQTLLEKFEDRPESKLSRAADYMSNHPAVNYAVSAGEIALGLMLMRSARKPAHAMSETGS